MLRCCSINNLCICNPVHYFLLCFRCHRGCDIVVKQEITASSYGNITLVRTFIGVVLLVGIHLSRNRQGLVFQNGTLVKAKQNRYVFISGLHIGKLISPVCRCINRR